MSLESKAMGRVLRIFCAVLMLSLGFAHKPVMAAVSLSPAYDEAYRLPDGSFAEVCAEHSGRDGSGHGDNRHSGDAIIFCDACLLASSILVPAPDDTSWLNVRSAWLENRLANRAFVEFASSTLSPNARGPPILFV